jgi:hypothetical protein
LVIQSLLPHIQQPVPPCCIPQLEIIRQPVHCVLYSIPQFPPA